jgi:hypothetical protein
VTRVQQFAEGLGPASIMLVVGLSPQPAARGVAIQNRPLSIGAHGITKVVYKIDHELAREPELSRSWWESHRGARPRHF